MIFLRFTIILKKAAILFFLLYNFGLYAQEVQSLFKTKKIIVATDTIFINKTSINPSYFKIFDAAHKEIDSSKYNIIFDKSALIFDKKYVETSGFQTDSLTVNYLALPDFLTKIYSIYSPESVVANDFGQSLYKFDSNTIIKNKPFDGLNTAGSITRGITVGNNQNSVVNSNLDLQISGKISDKITLKASIQDSNLPLRNGGYSQKIGEFDQIFIEMTADKWSVRAGDLFLENRQSKYLNFNKRVQGLFANVNFGTEDNYTSTFASAAIVRGKYAKSSFVGQEGNQGPYKLRGENGELYILVIPGSERVFVNGILKKLGENDDYIIDNNAGEIKFTTQFPINSEMRIVIEYQYTDQNYTRFVSYAGANHDQKKWSLGAYVYNENDLKNQSVQQNISASQAQFLANAGDDVILMNAPSAFADTYSANKILYKKELLFGTEIFVFSSNPLDVLYNVKFSFVGTNAGNYILANASTIGKIYQYIAPIAGVKQGNYEAIVQLVPPTQIQLATFLGKYKPTEKTAVDYEITVSSNDKNLFSSKDDADNEGVAGRLNVRQRLFSSKWAIDGFGSFQFIHKNFKAIERLFSIEFDRDWNIPATNAVSASNQSYLIAGVDFSLPNKGKVIYEFENLNFENTIAANKHNIMANFTLKNIALQNKSSYLASDGNYSKSSFLRSNLDIQYRYKKNWLGSSFKTENNQERLKSNNQLSALSQKFTAVGANIGRGDSTKVFVEIGYLRRLNDSLQNGVLQRVNASDEYFLNSRLIKNEKNELSLYVNYRSLKPSVTVENSTLKTRNSLNSKLMHNGRFFDNLIQTVTLFETTAGTIPQQEFTYLEVAPTMGIYAWNDYNANGIQELVEFEISPFPDQAKYVRVYLPNQIFIKTHQNRFSESLTLNPNIWQNNAGFKRFLSHFYNQSSYLIERKEIRNTDNFNLNPFRSTSKQSADLLGLNINFRNNLYYNRAKQLHSVTYSYIVNSNKNLLSVGSVENEIKTHQLLYEHLFKKLWLVTAETKLFTNAVRTENYQSRNFDIMGQKLGSKISYLFNKNASWDLFYEWQKKTNGLGLETLKQNRFGTAFNYTNEKKFNINGEFSLYDNNFVGNELLPVSFQMLEGLQSGKNTTWRLVLQKNLTQYLELNINYQGRKTEMSQVIHTGNIQLRANF